MSIFFDEDKALTPESTTSWAKGSKTDYSENFDAMWNAFGRSELYTSEAANLSEEYGNAVQLLHEAGHTDFVNPLDTMGVFSGEGDEEVVGYRQTAKLPDREKAAADFWKKVAELQLTDENLKFKLSEAGLDTKENMQSTIAKKAHSAWEEFAKINERASGEWYSGGGKTGALVGAAARAFTDPIMLATIPVSFGYSIPATFTKAAWKVAKYEMVIGAVAETMIQLKSQPYRAELGFEDAGLETGLKNIAMVTAAAGVLSPALVSVFKAFGKGIDVGKKHLFKLSDADLNKVSKELGDINPKYKDKALDNYKFPEKDNPFPDNAAGRTEHRVRLDAAVKSVNENTVLDLPPPKNKIIYHGTDKYFKEFDLNKTADQSIWFTDDVNAVKKGIVGASAKGNIIERIIDETKLRLATREQADPLFDEQLIAQGYDGIKFSDMGDEAGTYYRIFFPEKLQKTGTNSPNINKAGFNKNETKLAEDIEGVKDFDVPNEKTFRNQALYAEASMFDEGTSLAIRSEAGAGAAAKTVPTDKPLAKTQDLVSKSQVTDAPPPSTVLATAQSKPPLLTLGETNKVIGDINSIGKPIYHKTDNFNEIYKTLSAKMDSVKKELQPIATKYDGDLKARIKEKASLKEKLANDPNISMQNISDVLGTRISVDTITAAKLMFSELDKKFKLFFKDDFLDDVGRTLTHNTNYRRIHLQALTKDGYSFEIQVSLKELDPLIEINHAFYKKIKYQKDRFTASEMQDLIKKQTVAENNIKNKYFKIKDKEFAKSNPTNDVDVPFVVGTRLDEKGEIVPLMATARETFEQDAKDLTMLKRLENCI